MSNLFLQWSPWFLYMLSPCPSSGWLSELQTLAVALKASFLCAPLLSCLPSESSFPRIPGIPPKSQGLRLQGLNHRVEDMSTIMPREMTQLVKYLPHKHEDLSSYPQHPHKRSGHYSCWKTPPHPKFTSSIPVTEASLPATKMWYFSIVTSRVFSQCTCAVPLYKKPVSPWPTHFPFHPHSEAATVYYHPPINLPSEAYCMVWLCGVPWLQSATVPSFYLETLTIVMHICELQRGENGNRRSSGSHCPDQPKQIGELQVQRETLS